MQNITPSFDKYELMRIISRSNGVNSMKELQIRDIKHRIRQDFRKSIDAEDVTINGKKYLVLITRDKNDEQIKRIKSLPDERFDLGDIVNWNGTNYIIYKMDADRRIQSKGRMYECNMKLRWRNSNGQIIERVGKGEDATKYSEGTEGGHVLRIGEFQLKILITLDRESVLIRRDDRFIIDANPELYKFNLPKFSTDSEGNLIYHYGNQDKEYGFAINDKGDLKSELRGYYIDDNGNLVGGTNWMAAVGVIPSVYRVTRRNVVTGTFPDKGYIELTLCEDQFVAGHDDLENMIACRVSDIIDEGDSGHGKDKEELIKEEGWL